MRSLERQQALLDRFKVPERTGAFAGGGSSVYLLSQLGELWTESSLLDEAERLAGRLGEGVFWGILTSTSWAARQVLRWPCSAFTACGQRPVHWPPRRAVASISCGIRSQRRPA
jgi:hypothetical protein